jgi:cysteine desulfuration protein SufE
MTQVVARFHAHADWEDRYKELIQVGKEMPAYPEEFREEKFKVRGCQSQVWLHPTLQEGRVHFAADSDALLVKGIVGLLVHVYSGATPAEILATKGEFLKDIGITEHLSMNRTNGLASMMKQIQMYALVYQGMAGARP